METPAFGDGLVAFSRPVSGNRGVSHPFLLKGHPAGLARRSGPAELGAAGAANNV